MVCEIISSFKTISDIKNKILILSNNFKNEKIEIQNYDEKFKNYADKVAIECESYVSYNYIGMPLKENNIDV